MPLLLSLGLFLCVCNESDRLVGFLTKDLQPWSIQPWTHANSTTTQQPKHNYYIRNTRWTACYLRCPFLPYLLIRIFKVWASTSVVTFNATIFTSYQLFPLSSFVWEVRLIKCPIPSFFRPLGLDPYKRWKNYIRKPHWPWLKAWHSMNSMLIYAFR